MTASMISVRRQTKLSCAAALSTFCTFPTSALTAYPCSASVPGLTGKYKVGMPSIASTLSTFTPTSFVPFSHYSSPSPSPSLPSTPLPLDHLLHNIEKSERTIPTGPITRLACRHITLPTMCYQLVELYSVCRCLHYQHAVDRCAAYGQPGHGVQQRTILVGLACGAHASSDVLPLPMKCPVFGDGLHFMAPTQITLLSPRGLGNLPPFAQSRARGDGLSDNDSLAAVPLARGQWRLGGLVKMFTNVLTRRLGPGGVGFPDFPRFPSLFTLHSSLVRALLFRLCSVPYNDPAMRPNNEVIEDRQFTTSPFTEPALLRFTAITQPKAMLFWKQSEQQWPYYRRERDAYHEGIDCRGITGLSHRIP
ncbi:hypothetical protein SODALDRAFT_381483 [Sodiomyces alkalinus F11]|uniref:Uncharacterized protein n=1 Tax=Sodiomyces alkalinus (strain CBS 110278 / VKM F-3762 / F11) TaxID=1314773 RepID=A0A3N2PLA9_SODAK|nr:hypothetical protein SODALDRAFT_381483 [Sodiomyces alkalinus F11]ROT35307.1 hypothetical protein SODALDRAFT_381483 [Sodiomyces alkalinus F11]